MKLALRLTPRSFCYLRKYRGHGPRSRCIGHGALPKIMSTRAAFAARVRMPVRSPRSRLLHSPPNPLLRRSPLRFPLRHPYHGQTLVLNHAPRAFETRCVLESSVPVPQTASTVGKQGPPRLLGHPLRACPGHHTPLVRRHLAHYRWRHCCLQAIRRLGLFRNALFSGPHTHGSRARCLRFNDDVTGVAARLATGLPGSALARWGLHPLDD